MGHRAPGTVVLSGQMFSECLKRILEAESTLASVRTRLENICEDVVEDVDYEASPLNPEKHHVFGHYTQAVLPTMSETASPRAGMTRTLSVSREVRVSPSALEPSKNLEFTLLEPPQSSWRRKALDSPARSQAHINTVTLDQLRQPEVQRAVKKWIHLDRQNIVDQVMVDALFEANGVESPTFKDTERAIVTVGMMERNRSGLMGLPGTSAQLQGIIDECNGQHVQHVQHTQQPAKQRFSWYLCFLLRCMMIHPESRRRMIWLVLGLIFIIFEAYSIPLTLAFSIQPEGFFFVVTTVINVYFLLDICMTFMTGYINSKGMLVLDLKKVSQKYARGWFVLDLIAGIPWEWFAGSSDSPVRGAAGLKFLRSFRLLRLTKLLRLMRQKSITEKIELFIEANQFCVFVAGIVKILFLLFGVTHWWACAWYVIGMRDVEPPDKTWVQVYVADRWSEDDKTQRYIYSVFFTLTTMTTVGYGTPAPVNHIEVCFVLVLLLTASILFAILMGVLTDLIRNLNNETNIKNERKAILSRYMRWRAVPRDLFLTVRQHLLFLWDANEGYEPYEADLKNQLPPVLKTELCFHIYGRILQNAPFLMWMQDYGVCLKELSTMVQSIFLSRGDLLFRVGHPNEQIYILLSGSVWLTRNDSLSNEDKRDSAESAPRQLGSFSQTSSTGDLEGFTIPRNKEAGIIDVGMMLWKGTKTSKHVMPNNRLLGKMRDQAQLEAMTAELKRLGRRRRQPGERPMQSQILQEASLKLRLHDVRARRAAALIQSRWRKKHALRASLRSCDSPTRKPSLRTMQSKTVHAPAYFGEACLWAPLDTWGQAEPPLYLYTARCESRGELVYISRSVIQDIIERFSPWLPERFELFREAVLDAMTKLANGGDSSKAAGLPVDWAALDVSMPEDGISMTASHCRTLLRRVSSRRELQPEAPLSGPVSARLRRSGSMSSMPVMPRVPHGQDLGRGFDGTLSSSGHRSWQPDQTH